MMGEWRRPGPFVAPASPAIAAPPRDSRGLTSRPLRSEDRGYGLRATRLRRGATGRAPQARLSAHPHLHTLAVAASLCGILGVSPLVSAACRTLCSALLGRVTLRAGGAERRCDASVPSDRGGRTQHQPLFCRSLRTSPAAPTPRMPPLRRRVLHGDLLSRPRSPAPAFAPGRGTRQGARPTRTPR